MKPDTLRKLAALGLTTEQIAGVMEVMEADADEGKEKARARWRKWKANQPETNVGKRLQTDTNVCKQLVPDPARVEDNLLPKKISGQEERKQESRQAASTPASELEAVLDAEHAKAVVEHRQRLRKPLTAYAAKQLAKRLSGFPEPNAAADRMVEKGWLSIEPEWGNGSPPSRAGPALQPRQAFNDILDSLQGKNGHDAYPGPTIDGSVDRADSSGAANLVQLNAFSARR